jgi:phospholipase A-2-activating protein
VRALAKLPKGHKSGGEIVSATNDGVIRIWTLNGKELKELVGHESFIYSLAVLPSGDIVSSGEDRTVRIWDGPACLQVITLPAISVWSVAACPNGDIITGSSDKIARIFTQDEKRLADPAVIAEFDEQVQSSVVRHRRSKKQMAQCGYTPGLHHRVGLK